MGFPTQFVLEVDSKVLHRVASWDGTWAKAVPVRLAEKLEKNRFGRIEGKLESDDQLHTASRSIWNSAVSCGP